MYFAGSNYRDFAEKPRKKRKLIPAKISSLKVIKELVFDEVVRKRIDQLNSLVDGFKFCGFYGIMKSHKDVVEKVLILNESLSPLTYFPEAI